MTPQALPSNPQRTVGCVWLVIALAGGFGAVVPFAADIDPMKGGGALILLGLLLGITGVVVAFVYFGRASTLTRLLTTERLVYWRYEPEEWARYTEAEHGRQKGELRGLFITVAVISLVVGVGFLIADPDAGKFVFLVLLGVVALCGLAALISSASRHARNTGRVGDVYISASGVYLNEVLHTWRSFGGRLDRVAYEEASPPYLEFVYSVPSRVGRQSASVRVPVPRGQEPVARGLASQFEAGIARA